MFTNFKRVFKFALSDFNRNRGLSVAAIFVLTITILLVTSLFFMHGISDFIITSIQNKIDITAYFKTDTQESDILNVRDQILKTSPDVKSIQYVSKDDALQIFTETHKGNTGITDALTQAGEYPLLPSLNITTNEGDPAEYQKVADILQGDQYSQFIEKVNLFQTKDTIEKVFSWTHGANTFGLVLAGILIFIVVLVVFNTIKLIIDASKEEITTMRIVGASSWFVKSPYIIQGAIFGFVAFMICFLVTIFLVFFLSGGLLAITKGFSLSGYFISNFFIIVLMQLCFGVGLGVVSSFIVVQRYLKV